MADWTQPFAAAYRFVRVSRATGYELGQIDAIRGGTLTINQDTQTFESAQVDTAASIDIGSDLIRCYLDATFEDGDTETVCLGTWLVAIPERDVNGAVETCAAYLDGRLSELQDDAFDSIVTIAAGTNVVSAAQGIAEGAGLTVRATASVKTLGAAWRFGMEDDGEQDGGSKLDAINALMRLVGYAAARTDTYGTVTLAPASVAATDAPVWTFAEGANATFLSEATDERDSRDVHNVVQAIFETDGATTIGEAIDDDPNSPYSTVTLGRRKVVKYKFYDTATQAQANAKAAELLATDQSVVHRVMLQHVWCGARVGDVVAVEWPTAGITGRYVIRTQRVQIGSAGCLTTSELRAFERRGGNA